MQPTSAPSYALETLAQDALAAAGHIVRGVDLATFDPVRALLADRHAPLMRGLRASDVQVAAGRIAPQLTVTMRAVQLQLAAEVADLG